MTEGETFYSYKGYRWFWVSLLILAALIGVYVTDQPIGGRNGGTVYGYTTGGLATLGILYLMYFGIRKRSYRSSFNTLKAALSAHVWLGILLAFVVLLHSAFSFGLNVHTLAYVLMLITICSGIWGAINYSYLPKQIHSHRGEGTQSQLLAEIGLIDQTIGKILDKKSDSLVGFANKIDFTYSPSIYSSFFRKTTTIEESSSFSSLIHEMPAEEQQDAIQIVSLIGKKRALAAKIEKETRTFAILKIWLYLHVPISFGLLAALFIHILSVFYYW